MRGSAIRPSRCSAEDGCSWGSLAQIGSVFLGRVICTMYDAHTYDGFVITGAPREIAAMLMRNYTRDFLCVLLR